MMRRSAVLALFVTRSLVSRALTMRVMVGGRTCSASASWPRVMGPAKTMTERAERRAALRPDDASLRRRLRNRWMAAEWRAWAVESASRWRGVDIDGGVHDKSLA